MRDILRRLISSLLITLLSLPGSLAAQVPVRREAVAGTTTIEGNQVPPGTGGEDTVFPIPPAVLDVQYAVTPTDVYLTWTDALPKYIYSPDAAFIVSRKEVGKDADFVPLTPQPVTRISSPDQQPPAWPARLGNFHNAFQTTLPLRLQQMVTAPVPPAQLRSLEATPRFLMESRTPSAGTAAQAPAPQPLQTPAQVAEARSMVASPGTFTYERFHNVLDRRADRGLLLATFHVPSAVLRAVGFFDTTVEAGKHYLYRVEMITGTPNPDIYQSGGRLVIATGSGTIPAGAAPIPAGTRFVIGQTSKEVVAGQITSPPAPTNLKAEESVEQIYLSWDLVPESEGYLVYRAEAGSSNFLLLTQQPVVPAAQLAQGRLGAYSATAERSAMLQQAMAASQAKQAGASKTIATMPPLAQSSASSARMATMGLPSNIANLSITAPRAESMAQAKVPARLATMDDRLQLSLAQHLLLPSYYYADTPPDLRKAYIYKVASRDLLGQGNDSSPSSAVHAHHIPIPVPHVHNVTQPTDRGVVRLAWDTVADPLVDSLNVRIAEATTENPNTSQVVATLPANATHYDFTTKKVRHPFQFCVTAVGVTHDSNHPDESKPSERVTAAARKLELPTPPVSVTVTPIQSVDQLNNDPSVKVVDVLITWRVKEDDPDLAGFRILKSNTPANPEGLKYLDQHFQAVTKFVQANPELMSKSVAQQVVVPQSMAAESAAAAVSAKPVSGKHPATVVSPRVPQMTVTQVQPQMGQAPAASQAQFTSPSARARIVQPFNLRPDVVAAPRSEPAKGLVAILAREIPQEQTIGTVLVDEFSPQTGNIMQFNPATRASLTSKFGFKTTVSPMLYYKSVSGALITPLSQTASSQMGRNSAASSASPTTGSLSATGANSSSSTSPTTGSLSASGANSSSSTSPTTGSLSASSANSSSSTSPATGSLSASSANSSSSTSPTTPSLSATTIASSAALAQGRVSKVPVVPAVSREAISPQLLHKATMVSVTKQYQFIDHIPIASRNVQYYRVSSYDQGYVESSYSDKVRFTLASYIKPYPPRLVHLELTDDRKVSLTWRGIPETDFSGFNIYRLDASAPGASREKVNNAPLGFGVNNFVDENPLASKRATYLVTTVNTEGLESEPSNAISVTLPPSPESLAVGNLQASWNPTVGGVQLDWQAPTGRTDVIGYVVFRDPGPEDAASAKPDSFWGYTVSPLLTATQFVDSGVLAAGTYTYRVVAFTAEEGGLPPGVISVNISSSPSP